MKRIFIAILLVICFPLHAGLWNSAKDTSDRFTNWVNTKTGRPGLMPKDAKRFRESPNAGRVSDKDRYETVIRAMGIVETKKQVDENAHRANALAAQAFGTKSAKYREAKENIKRHKADAYARLKIK